MGRGCGWGREVDEGGEGRGNLIGIWVWEFGRLSET